MKTSCSAYYWIMGLTCIIPGIFLLVPWNRAGGDRIFFSLLFLSAVGFVVAVFVVSWKRAGEVCDI